MIQRFIPALLVALTLVAVGCSEEEKKSSSTTDTGATSGSDGTSGATSGSDGTSGATSGSDTSGATSGTDDTSGSTSGTSDVTADDTSGSTSGDTSGVTPTTDLCQGAEDKAYLAGTVADGKHAGKTGRDAAAAAARTCGLKFLAEDDPKPPTVACMTTDPENIALTDGCAGCYGDIVVCSISNCAGPCSAGTAEQCSTCQADAGCTDAFNVCAGPLD